jgi:hypothetical protein
MLTTHVSHLLQLMKIRAVVAKRTVVEEMSGADEPAEFQGACTYCAGFVLVVWCYVCDVVRVLRRMVVLGLY